MKDSRPKRTTNETFRLREWRERVGLSQRDLAREAGLALTTVNALETGKREPNWRTLRRLADFFQVPVPALYATPDSAAADAETVLAALARLTDVMPHEGEFAAARVAAHLKKVGITAEDASELEYQVEVAEAFLVSLRAVLHLRSNLEEKAAA